ncbi:hypothetical protein G4B88_010299 [Cannabis sativa]|uniref:DUF4283 domain-containing protein n=1 Tax=Cannabis sativa TaxID=3483 RepID=A0A7J6I5L5_CANSA|nr:hypothetical protein G4B88_010299 [Cannabis sativa]
MKYLIIFRFCMYVHNMPSFWIVPLCLGLTMPSSSSSLQSPSSSPSIGVNVRPFRGGSRINLCLQILDSSSVNRRNSAFTPPVFSFTGDPSPLLVTFIDPLGATVQNAETIIRISSMEKFWFNAFCPLMILVQFSVLYITEYPLYQKIMEDLSHTLTTTLNLIEFETQIHAFPNTAEHPEDDTREEPSAFLAVKLLTTRHFNSEAFKQRLCQMWPEHFSINVLEKEPNFFTVEFGCFGDRRRVLIGQPWHFNYKLIVMTPLEAGSVVTTEMLTSTPFWIQVSGSKIRVTSNPFYIANTRTRLRPHIASPSSLAPTPLYRLNQPFIITESSFNESPYDYGMQHLGQPHTTSLGFYMASSSPNIFPQQPHDLNQPAILNPLTSGLNTAITLSSGFHMSLHQHTTTNLNPNHSAPVTTAEQLQASFPKASLTAAATVVATSCDNHHVIPISQAFSTILADLNPTQPPRFAIGTTSASTPKTNLSRKAKLDRPDGLNAEELIKLTKPLVSSWTSYGCLSRVLRIAFDMLGL